jgi:hypothetical protein
MYSTHNKYGSRKIGRRYKTTLSCIQLTINMEALKIGRRYKTTLSCIQLTINMEAGRLADDIKQHCHAFNSQ